MTCPEVSKQGTFGDYVRRVLLWYVLEGEWGFSLRIDPSIILVLRK